MLCAWNKTCRNCDPYTHLEGNKWLATGDEPERACPVYALGQCHHLIRTARICFLPAAMHVGQAALRGRSRSLQHSDFIPVFTKRVGCCSMQHVNLTLPTCFVQAEALSHCGQTAWPAPPSWSAQQHASLLHPCPRSWFCSVQLPHFNATLGPSHTEMIPHAMHNTGGSCMCLGQQKAWITTKKEFNLYLFSTCDRNHLGPTVFLLACKR